LPRFHAVKRQINVLFFREFKTTFITNQFFH
jgi:hypothetical protein